MSGEGYFALLTAVPLYWVAAGCVLRCCEVVEVIADCRASLLCCCRLCAVLL